jgi:UDP-N-acetylmuramate dehydrogenase
MFTLRKFIEKINTEASFEGLLRYDEPMAAHSSFRVGGAADLWVQPRGNLFPSYAATLLRGARDEGIPVFVLGAGSNLVVADRGIRGIVLDTGGWTGWEEPAAGSAVVRAGTPVDTLAEAWAGRGWAGPEFLAGMPGSLGGAVWMNARCYGNSMDAILLETEILDESLVRRWEPRREGDFSYKKSPFQGREVLILAARLRVRPGAAALLTEDAAACRRDREAKGHYRFPSAGSVFKNRRDLGVPMGRIIEELGLRGLRLGGAAVAPYHGNIIINTGNAAAADIRDLTALVARKVEEARGIAPEPELCFAGDWDPPARRT